MFNQMSVYEYLRTHGVNNLPIPALVYCKNHLDSHSCGRGRGGEDFSKL